jgi:alkaline phosphatase
MKINLLLFQIFVALNGLAQSSSNVQVFAHNDYVQPIPFFNAHRNQVGYLEADVFLERGKLLVAHTRAELNAQHTLDSLYLRPLLAKVIYNNGYPFADTKKPLTLMLDIKSDGATTLTMLVKSLNRYPQLVTAKQLSFVISGNIPDPATWSQYPDFIRFDGRPGIKYSAYQLNRISLVSDSFQKYSQWNGKGIMPDAERTKIEALTKEVHAAGKKIRFWAAPDFPNAWLYLMKLEINVIGTDRVDELVTFLETLPKRTFTNKNFHAIYTPTYSHNRDAKPRNIILMIGDGTGLAQWFSGYTSNHAQLNVFGIKDIGLVQTASADSYITDSAAGATAMATGYKTKNRYVGVDPLGKPLVLITELLKSRNFKTAIISNGDITDATPGSFYAHKRERSWSEAIALDFLESKNDILIGGGVAAFQQRKDRRDLLNELSAKGYTTSNRFASIDSVKNQKLVIIDDVAIKQQREGRGDFLTRSFNKTTSLFTTTTAPFFILLEAAQVDWGGHSNDVLYIVTEVLDFDEVIGDALKFVDINKETLLIITADHETGGLSLLGGDIEQGIVSGSFSTNDHTPIPVPVFAYGPGSALFAAVYQNTEIFNKIMELLER